MRFLGVGDTCDLGALYLRLQHDGHEVRVAIGEKLAQGTLAGMAERVEDWRASLPWVREAGDDGIILFENVASGRGQVQDALRRDGYHVIGGSAFGDRLENDRGYAQKVLADLGFKTATVAEFRDYGSAASFIDENPARYVLKFNGTELSSSDNYVGWSRDGLDTKAMLRVKLARAKSKDLSFILMTFIEGIEMGVGAYFDGDKFLGRACLDWEHKRFFPGDLGELTGEMGTVVTYDRTSKFFEKTLAKLQPLLRTNGYCGYINLNTIVNAEGIWPLEFTCRFGYPGFAILTPLQKTSWASLFKAMIARQGSFETHAGFCVGIVLTTPPFPYNRKLVEAPVGLPIWIDDLNASEKTHIHFGEVGLEGGELVTTGLYGWSIVVTGTGETIQAAQKAAVALARKVRVADLRYRTDIGVKLVQGELAQLEAWKLLD